MRNQKITLDTRELLGFRLADTENANVSSRLETKISKGINPPFSKVGKPTIKSCAMVGKRDKKSRHNMPVTMVGKDGKSV